VEGVVSKGAGLDAFAGKRVLITGHTGFKGSWLALWLRRLGAEVAGFSDAVPTSPSHFEALNLDIDDRRGDIGDADAVNRLMEEIRPDIVFHLAAQSLVRRAYSDIAETYRTNVLGSLNVMEAARNAGVSAFVSATTDKVYRNYEREQGYREDDELGGSDPYSASKSCVELMTRSYRESFLRDGSMLIATVRAGNVIGGGDWAEDRLVPDLMRAAFSGEPAIIRNPASTRPWQHVLDVLRGYLIVGSRLLAGDGKAAEAWNFGPRARANISVSDIIDAIRRQIPELEIELVADTSGRHESGLLQLDSSKAMDRLGWEPAWEGEMLERTVDWYRAYHDGGSIISTTQLDAFEAALA
jgi:CDP-glucose 4,6-dehydratase